MQSLRVAARLVRSMHHVTRAWLPVTSQAVTFRNASTSTLTATLKKEMPKPSGFKLPKPFIPKGTTLPCTVNFQGERFRVENITLDRAQEAWDIIYQAVEKGEGYSRDEMETIEEFSTSIQTKNNYFQLIHEENDDMVSVINLVNCPMARSEKAVHFAGTIIISQKYRNKNLGRYFVSQIYLELGRVILGHQGIVAARTVVAKSINAVVRAGNVFNGMIPNCSYLEGKGRIMDLIFTTIDPRHVTEILTNAPVPELPPLVVREEVPESLQSSQPLLQTLPDLPTSNNLILKVTNASPEDIWNVEQIIRQAAQEGDGFGIDEFTKDGHFNRKTLYSSNVIVAKSSSTIVAVAIFGPSKFCRANNTEQMGGYVLVNSEFRRRGIGSAFVNHLIGMKEEMGATSILTDAYTNNIAAQQFLDKLNFIVTGTIPHCGYVLGKGYRPSYMYWRTV